MKKFVKIILISNACSFIFGGLIYESCFCNKETRLINEQVETQIQKEQTIELNRQQDNNKSQVVLETEYSSKGTIKKTIEIHTDYKATTKIETSTISKVQNKDTEIIKSKEIIAPQKNWTLTGFIPMSNYTDYSEYTLQISYRVIGPLYASFQTNLLLNRPMMGIGVEF